MKATQTTPSWITETPPPKPVEPETTNLGNPFGGMSKDVPSFVSMDGAASTPSVDDIALADTPQGGLIKTWSPTALQKFEACQWQVYLQRVKKIKQESGEAAQRGTNIHDQAEHFIYGEVDPMPKTLMKFQKQFEYLREEFAEGRVLCEQDWGFTPDWKPVPVVWDKPQHWAMMKLDALHLQSETSARVVDFKTGKKFGNEMKHNAQGQIYTIGTFMRYPKLEFIETEFWYLDKNEVLENTYTREQAMHFLDRLQGRAEAMTRALKFIPSPSTKNCQWCPYGINKGNGACDYAI